MTVDSVGFIHISDPSTNTIAQFSTGSGPGTFIIERANCIKQAIIASKFASFYKGCVS